MGNNKATKNIINKGDKIITPLLKSQL